MKLKLGKWVLRCALIARQALGHSRKIRGHTSQVSHVHLLSYLSCRFLYCRSYAAVHTGIMYDTIGFFAACILLLQCRCPGPVPMFHWYVSLRPRVAPHSSSNITTAVRCCTHFAGTYTAVPCCIFSTCVQAFAHMQHVQQ